MRCMTMPFSGPWVFVLLAGVRFIAAIGFYPTREPQVQDGRILVTGL